MNPRKHRLNHLLHVRDFGDVSRLADVHARDRDVELLEDGEALWESTGARLPEVSIRGHRQVCVQAGVVLLSGAVGGGKCVSTPTESIRQASKD